MTKSEVKAIAEILKLVLPAKFNSDWLYDRLQELNLDIGVDMDTGDWVIMKCDTHTELARLA